MNMNVIAPRALARDARRQAILDIARDSFLMDGFAATSMSAIAVKLGGSKGTLYNYFRSKEELFEAIMQQSCGGEAAALSAIGEGGDLETVLRRLGERFVANITTAEAVGLYRLVAAESSRFPELGAVFWENGPRLSVLAVAAYLSEQMELGTLRRHDPERAASHLLAMFKAQLHQAVIWNVWPMPTEAQITEQADAAVQAFLRGYGPAEQAA